jgi:hypothetical protein|tara:strand:+ start:684 stop:845 length:162 start_codon:yes stop_codon:yes gene_type:complete
VYIVVYVRNILNFIEILISSGEEIGEGEGFLWKSGLSRRINGFFMIYGDVLLL